MRAWAEIPGEYCPGEYSVHAQLPASAGGGRIKLVGTAQRVVTGGWWFSTGIVVSDSAPLRAVTADVYRALGSGAGSHHGWRGAGCEP